MIDFDSYRLELEAMEEPLAQLKKALHIEHLGDEISELESRAQEPGFWEDTDKAQKVQTRLKNLQKKLDRFHKMERQRDDLLVLCELGDEAEDVSLLPELSEGMGHLKEEMDRLRLETLFTGEYDANNAILTLHAGAGGTEAQDWNEMLFRMYTRWAESHGFEVKVLDILEGEEAGLKSVSFQLIGDNAYRRFAHRHLPRFRFGRAAHQQDRLRGPDHPHPDRRRDFLPDRAVAAPEPGNRDDDAPLQVVCACHRSPHGKDR